MSDWNQAIIEEFRANDGEVQTYGFGRGLVLLHNTGAKSGEARITPVAGFRDGDGWLVAASKAGAPEHPAWYFNLKAHPDASVEAPGETGTIDVTATEIGADEYDAVWDVVVARAPGFADYRTKTEGIRTIPVFRLTRR